MSDPRARSPGKFIYHQNPPIYIYIYKSFCLPANKSSQDIHLPASDGSGPSNLASAQISSSTRGNFPDRHANDKGDNGKAWTKHWASTPLQVDCHFWVAFGTTTWPSIHQQLVYSYLRGTNFWKMDNSTKVASLLGSMIVSTRVTTMSHCFTWIVWQCLPHFDSIRVIRRGIPLQNIWSQNPLPMEPWKCTSLFTSARCFKSILATSWCPPAADRCKAVHPAACWHRMFGHLTEDLTQKKKQSDL